MRSVLASASESAGRSKTLREIASDTICTPLVAAAVNVDPAVPSLSADHVSTPADVHLGTESVVLGVPDTAAMMLVAVTEASEPSVPVMPVMPGHAGHAVGHVLCQPCQQST